MLQQILITGGFGYVGGRLAQHLIRLGETEIALGTRRSALSPSWAPTASVVEMQWQSQEELSVICEGKGAVVHLAGMNASQCAADPLAALDVNGLSTSRLLRAAITSGVKRFIYVSTAHVYDAMQGVITEDSRVTALHPYATSHRAGEDAVLYAHQRREIEGVVVRLSNSFGAPAHKDADCWMLLVNDLCRQIARTRKMVLRTTGLQRRDFIPLTDTCRALAHFLELDSVQLGDGLYNVGSGESEPIIEMVDRIGQCCERLYGYSPEVIRPKPSDGDAAEPFNFCIDKLLRTGFALSGDTDAEINRTLEFCAAERSAIALEN